MKVVRKGHRGVPPMLACFLVDAFCREEFARGRAPNEDETCKVLPCPHCHHPIPALVELGFGCGVEEEDGGVLFHLIMPHMAGKRWANLRVLFPV